MKFALKACTALVALTALTTMTGAAQAADRTKVTIAVGTTVLDASQANNTSVPIATGCWEKEGLDVTIQPTNSSAATQAVLSGQAQFVLMGPGRAVISRAQGAPLKAVYMNMRKNFQFPVVLESSPIQSVADFKGKTMGVISYGAQLVSIIKGMAAEAGLDPDKDLTIIETGVGAQAVSALTSGRVDVWGTWDSQIATAENMGIKLRRFTSPYAEKLTFGSSYFVRDDYIKSHPEVIAKVLRCVARSTVMTAANPEGAVKAHWRVYPATKPTGVSEDEAFRQAMHILKVRDEFLALEPGVRWGEFPKGSVADMVAFMKATGELKGDVKPDDLFTNQFIDAINDFDAAAAKRDAAALK